LHHSALAASQRAEHGWSGCGRTRAKESVKTGGGGREGVGRGGGEKKRDIHRHNPNLTTQFAPSSEQ
jgi:hypothetical protein